MSDRLGNQISDLAVQVSTLTNSITSQSTRLDRIETAIDNLVQESRQNNETAKLQAQNVSELIKTVPPVNFPVITQIVRETKSAATCH
jgi:uncharacterized protein (DUF3084 family)